MRMGQAGALQRMVMHVAALLFPRRRRHRPVRYGGRAFSSPQLLTEALLPADPGLYAIQVRKGWSGMKPIQFGASHNLREEMMVDGHEGFVQWLMHRGARRGVYVSFQTVPELDHEARHREGLRLNQHYFPRRTQAVDEFLAGHRIHRSPRLGGLGHSTEH